MEQVVEPETEYCPTEQIEQELNPNESPKEPLGQSKHWDAPFWEEYLPREHKKQEVAAELDDEPTAQSKHWDAPVLAEYLPWAQEAQDPEANELAKYPIPQSMQMEDPVVEYCPRLHLLHAVTPVTFAYKPAGHERQTVADEDEE